MQLQNSEGLTCRACGKPGAKPEHNLCLTCAHWARIYAQRRDDAIIIDGKAYFTGREDAYIGNKGYGGRRFEILKNGSERIVTTNLNTAGEIPAHFRTILPDNAEFVGATPQGQTYMDCSTEKLASLRQSLINKGDRSAISAIETELRKRYASSLRDQISGKVA